MNHVKVLLFTIVLQFLAHAQVDTNSEHYYILVYFLNSNDQGGAYLAFSSDGLNWQKYNLTYNNETPVIVPTIGSEKRMRDPNIYFDKKKGVFHLVWTTGWRGTDIGYATSRDLKHWSEQYAIPVGKKISNTSIAWSPEITFDDLQNKFMLYWSSDSSKDEFRGYYSLTSDFKTFSFPKKYFDPGYKVIDETIVKIDNNKYYMFFKDQRAPFDAAQISNNIHFVYGPTLQGPWSTVSKAITNTGCEGPSAIKIGNEFRVYFDPYINYQGTYRMVKVTNLDTTIFPWPSSDTLKTQTSQFYFSHGSISEIPRAKAMYLLYGIADTTTYDTTAYTSSSYIYVEDPIQYDTTPVLIPMKPDTQYVSRPVFAWYKKEGVTFYRIQIDTTYTFADPLIVMTVTDTTYTPTIDLPYKRIFWRIGAVLSKTFYSYFDRFNIVRPNGIKPASFSPSPDNDPVQLQTQHGKIVATINLAQNSELLLEIFSVSGVKIATMYKGALPANVYQMSWDQRNNSGRVVPAGSYIIVATINYNRYVKKTLLID